MSDKLMLDLDKCLFMKNLLRKLSRLAQDASFEPYLSHIDINGVHAKFLLATPLAKRWYDPIKPYAQLEYEWVVRNVKLKGQNVLDGGSHHGQYSVVLAAAAENDCYLVSVDPLPVNCALTEVNLRLNGYEPHIYQCALSEHNGEVRFDMRSNGRIVDSGGVPVPAKTIDRIQPDSNVVKLDLEGAEYAVLPPALEVMTQVHTWIVEIHPSGNPHPDTLISALFEKGFEVLYVDRAANDVVPYRLQTPWKVHSTIFARR